GSLKIERWNFCAVGRGHGACLLCVAAVEQWTVEVFQHGGRSPGIGSNYAAVRIQEIADSAAFAEELRIRSNVEILVAVDTHGLLNPCVGVNGNRALLNNELIALRGPGDLVRHGLHVG